MLRTELRTQWAQHDRRQLFAVASLAFGKSWHPNSPEPHHVKEEEEWKGQKHGRLVVGTCAGNLGEEGEGRGLYRTPDRSISCVLLI